VEKTAPFNVVRHPRCCEPINKYQERFRPLAGIEPVTLGIKCRVFCASYNAHTPPVENPWIFDNIYIYFVCIFMFKVAKHIYPQIFDSTFVQNKNIHNNGTRHIELYCSPIAKTNLMRNSLRCAGVIISNKYTVLSD